MATATMTATFTGKPAHDALVCWALWLRYFGVEDGALAKALWEAMPNKHALVKDLAVLSNRSLPKKAFRAIFTKLGHKIAPEHLMKGSLAYSPEGRMPRYSAAVEFEERLLGALDATGMWR